MVSETLSLQLPNAIRLTPRDPIALHVTPKQFEALSAANPDLILERTTTGELIVNPPTGGEIGYHNSKIVYIT